ncbi:hypothetical protein [Roseomonas sp. HF4]|uniref:hypothetical protein n=1 Tax=Roseomonas sp. HF4 TaxID=2562313 RepID=UPI0010C0C7B7|nr:hypothetical protein [Roseomonas sp. HF4]
MGAIRRAYGAIEGRQRGLARAGLGMLVVLAACLLAMGLDGREIRGVSVWLKPAKFAASLALWAWTLAWFWPALAPEARRGRAARIIVAGTIAFMVLEICWIALSAALGVPSHFARTPLGGAIYPLMGAVAVIGCALAAWFGVLVALRGNPALPGAWRFAVALGFLLGGVLGGLTGAAISGADGPYVDGAATDAGGIAPFFWSRAGGDLRVAHFIGVHAMQAIPLAGWAAAALPRPRAWILAGAALWAGLTLAAFVQARAGLPFA